MNALYGERGFEFIHVRDMGIGHRVEDEDRFKALKIPDDVLKKIKIKAAS